MKLVLHLVRTDLRRLAAWLLLWAAVLVAMDLLGFAVLASEPTFAAARVSPWRNYELTRNVLVAAEVLIAFTLVVLLVQGDRVTGTRAFWMTRPISGARLLLAKCITTALILVAIPSLISLPWWLWCGFGTHEVGVGVRSFSVAAVAVALPAAFVASVMDTLSRALLWGMMVALVALVLLTVTVLGGRPTTGALPIVRVPLLTASVFATFAVVTSAQYVWRRVGITAVVFTVGVMMCGLGFGLHLGYIPMRLPHHEAIATAVQARLIGATAAPARGGAAVEVTTRFDLTGAPQGMLIFGTGVAETWSLSDRGCRVGAMTTLTPNFVADIPFTLGFHRVANLRLSTKVKLGPRAVLPSEELRVRQELQRREQLSRPAQSVTSDPAVVARTNLAPADAALICGDPVRFDAELGIAIVEPHIVAERPLGDTGWHAEGGRGLRIIGAHHRDESVGCGVITTAADTIFGPYPVAGDVDYRLVCGIIDHDANTVLPSQLSHEFGALSVNFVSISGRTFGGGPFAAGDRITVAPIALVEKAWVTRRVQVDNLRVNEVIAVRRAR